LRLFSFGGYGLALAALALVFFCAYDSYPLRLRLFSFGGYGLALAALALVVFGAYDSYPYFSSVQNYLSAQWMS